jgi:hypothetical protein
VAAGAAWFLIDRTAQPEIADFSFDFGKVGGSPVAERAPEEDLQAAALEIRETLDVMYAVGFVDNREWKGGTFPKLYDAFTTDLEAKVRRDLPNLTLGTDAAKIALVTPISGRLSIRFLVDEERQLIAATARTIFSANAFAIDGGDVAIQHDGTYYMEPLDGRWLIKGYDVEGIVTRVSQPLPERPAPGPQAT